MVLKNSLHIKRLGNEKIDFEISSRPIPPLHLILYTNYPTYSYDTNKPNIRFKKTESALIQRVLPKGDELLARNLTNH